MFASLTIIRYKTWQLPFALLAMALFRLPLWFRKEISFYKLMGSGRNGSFDKNPDLNQWAVFAVHRQPADLSSIQQLYGTFIDRWIKILGCTTHRFILDPLEGHGKWNGRQIFGELAKQPEWNGRLAVLTRATIRPGSLKAFWKNVPAVSAKMNSATGLQYSIGIGELPLIRQATFSVWEDMVAMKAFAYGMKTHSDVIKKTRNEDWYKEELFVRFKILAEVKD